MAVKTAIFDEIKTRNRPSFYAAPVAWAAVDFTRSLIEQEGEILPQQTGIIAASDQCSLSTIRELSRTAAEGTISPLRFAGASPSIVVGLPALQLGIRGPTVMLTMAPDHASGAILAMITYWMKSGDVNAVIAIAHYPQGERHHLFRGLIARSMGDELARQVAQLCDPKT